MNLKLTEFLKNEIESRGIKYTFISQKTGIEYGRLMRIFNQNAVITGSELLYISKLLGVKQETLMGFVSLAV